MHLTTLFRVHGAYHSYPLCTDSAGLTDIETWWKMALCSTSVKCFDSYRWHSSDATGSKMVQLFQYNATHIMASCYSDASLPAQSK
jgi:hypothetical protein